ncbi:hypothetical protein ABZ820_12325 [Streptomyces diacarni]|uniref:hypothetical protein n=1 Tax=Streptomyces diacarni TaxID=2800381 RepID=UPI0033EADB73
MSPGICSWHEGAAKDVEIIVVIERGTGPAAGMYACLPCALKLSKQFYYKETGKRAVAELVKRAAASPGTVSHA